MDKLPPTPPTPSQNPTPGGQSKKKRQLSLDPTKVNLASSEGASPSLAGGRVSPGEVPLERKLKMAPGSAMIATSASHAEAKHESEAFVGKMSEGLHSGDLHFEEFSRTISAPLVIKDKSGTPKAIFKPQEREVSQSRDGIHLGEGIYGELIGYQFGRDYGVPLTSLVYMSCSKSEGAYVYEGEPILGSLQEWSSLGEHMLSIPIERAFQDPLHSIAILDLRILNSDRHGNNILYDKTAGRFIPIDHGCSAPVLMDIDAYNFFWMHNPLSKEPFSQNRLQEIQAIDPEQDRNTVKELIPNIRRERLDSMQLSATILKRGAERGLTPFEIGSFFYNLQGSEHDPLATTIYNEALAENVSGNEAGYTRIINQKVDQYIDSYISLRMNADELAKMNSSLSDKEKTSDPVCNYCIAMNKRIFGKKE